MIFTDREAVAPALDSTSFINLICFRHQKHNLDKLREITGDKGLVTLLDKFAGTYVRFPTASHTLDAVNEVYLGLLYQDLKLKAKGLDPVAWNEAEKRFNKFAERMGLKGNKARLKAKEILKEIDKANVWWSEIKRFWHQNHGNEQL